MNFEVILTAVVIQRSMVSVAHFSLSDICISPKQREHSVVPSILKATAKPYYWRASLFADYLRAAPRDALVEFMGLSSATVQMHTSTWLLLQFLALPTLGLKV